MKLFLLLSAAFLAGCASRPDSPEACALVKQAELAVVFEGNLPTVLVTLSGQPVRMLLDTGSGISMISLDASERFGFASDPTMTTEALAINGKTSTHHNALISSFQVGDITWHNVSIATSQMSALTGHPDGLLGRDILGKFDLDFDMPHQRVGLYQPRNCPSGQPDWNAVAEVLPHAALGHAVPVNRIAAELDGTPMSAEIDSGATITMVDRGRALATGITEASLAADRQGMVQGALEGKIGSVLHTFTQLKVGSEILNRPRVLVVPLPDINRTNGLHMLLGEDYLRRHRLWISFDGFTVQVARPDQVKTATTSP